jgi:hypothetical protein
VPSNRETTDYVIVAAWFRLAAVVGMEIAILCSLGDLILAACGIFSTVLGLGIARHRAELEPWLLKLSILPLRAPVAIGFPAPKGSQRKAA